VLTPTIVSSSLVLRCQELLLSASGTSLEFKLDRPTARGIPAVFAGAVIATLLVMIFWTARITPVFLTIVGVVCSPCIWMAWLGVRRRKILIDPAQHRVTSLLSALGIVIRRTDLGPQQIDRIVVEGHSEDSATGGILTQARGREATLAPGFAIYLEGLIGRVELEESHDHEAAERRAATIAEAAGLPAIRRGYYLGKPREGAINRIDSEEAWELALTRGVIITGDPTDSGEI
jgi:hypothetical protein